MSIGGLADDVAVGALVTIFIGEVQVGQFSQPVIIRYFNKFGNEAL